MSYCYFFLNEKSESALSGFTVILCSVGIVLCVDFPLTLIPSSASNVIIVCNFRTKKYS